MKLFGVVAVLAAGMGAWADDRTQTPKRVVTVCLNPGADGSVMYRGEATASQILRQAGIQLDWRSDERACAEADGIVVTVSRETPLNQHPGALAYARPFDGARIVLFYDRVLNTAGPAVTPSLLGHVLAHEIVHILQAVDVHSASGIMKSRWDKQDYADMQKAPLPFTAEDLTLIDRGLERRASRANPGK